MQLDTDLVFCVVPSGNYLLKKSGEVVTYYKVLRFKDGCRHYVCSLTDKDLERIKCGVPAYQVLCENGVPCLPAKPKPAKSLRVKSVSWVQDFKVERSSEKL